MVLCPPLSASWYLLLIWLWVKTLVNIDPYPYLYYRSLPGLAAFYRLSTIASHPYRYPLTTVWGKIWTTVFAGVLTTTSSDGLSPSPSIINRHRPSSINPHELSWVQPLIKHQLSIDEPPFSTTTMIQHSVNHSIKHFINHSSVTIFIRSIHQLRLTTT